MTTERKRSKATAALPAAACAYDWRDASDLAKGIHCLLDEGVVVWRAAVNAEEGAALSTLYAAHKRAHDAAAAASPLHDSAAGSLDTAADTDAGGGGGGGIAQLGASAGQSRFMWAVRALPVFRALFEAAHAAAHPTYDCKDLVANFAGFAPLPSAKVGAEGEEAHPAAGGDLSPRALAELLAGAAVATRFQCDLVLDDAGRGCRCCDAKTAAADPVASFICATRALAGGGRVIDWPGPENYRADDTAITREATLSAGDVVMRVATLSHKFIAAGGSGRAPGLVAAVRLGPLEAFLGRGPPQLAQDRWCAERLNALATGRTRTLMRCYRCDDEGSAGAGPLFDVCDYGAMTTPQRELLLGAACAATPFLRAFSTSAARQLAASAGREAIGATGAAGGEVVGPQAAKS